MALKKIDFTSGIRSENIQYNFEYLQNDLDKNRLFTVGYGVADGLEISIDKDLYKITVDDGYIVDESGSMILVPGTEYSVDLASDVLQTVYKDYVINNGKIVLLDAPYASNGEHAAIIEGSSYDWRKDVTFSSILGTTIEPIGASADRTFMFNGIDDGTVVNAKYYSAKNIIYTIYVTLDYKIQICKSIASTSPSQYELSDFLYKLGNVFVYTNYNGYTMMTYIADMTDRINIYTSSNNELYIGGKRFSSMRHVYSYRPDEPELHDIWYNSDVGQNRLYVYAEVDGEYEWIPIGDYCFSAVFTKKFWNPSEESYNDRFVDNKYWIFSAAEQDMYFEPNSNSINVIFDNAPLHRDQFTEVKLSDITSLIRTSPSSHAVSVIRNLGYTDEFIHSLLYEIDLDGNIIKNKPDICIGFCLAEPVYFDFRASVPGPYIEAITSHLHNVPAQTYRFQKTTSFVSEYHYVYAQDAFPDKVFPTKHTYKVNEHQLEVYLNGMRLTCNVDYVETEKESVRSASSFKIIRALEDGAIITYRINAVCYSYDNDFCNDIPRGYYNFVIKRTDDTTDLLKIPNEYAVDTTDYLTIYVVSNKAILIRKDHNVDETIADYEIVKNESGAYIRLIKEPLVPLNESVYVTGIKFSKNLAE